VLKKLGEVIKSEKKLNRLLGAADPNRKGFVTFSKFVILMEINKKKGEPVNKEKEKKKNRKTD
jgi:Ca2+-binding EF-hand superfamily protein